MIEDLELRPAGNEGSRSCFEAIQRDRVLGRVEVDLETGELVALEVEAAHQRAGIGTELLALAEWLVQEKGGVHVRLQAPDSAHEFFRRRGYRLAADGWWKKRIEGKTTFDRAAQDYHAARPSYPEAAIEAVLSASGLEAGGPILEVGSGTGKATLPFAQRGFAMTCIEPGAKLAAVARRVCADFPQVHFEQTSFEAWPLEAGRFGLVISGQAFHWVDQEAGYRKAGDALREGGMLALFWNHAAPDESAEESEIRVALDEVYGKHAPQLGRRLPKSLRRVGSDMTLERIRRAKCFEEPAERSFPWSTSYTAAEYARLISTHSDHALLWEETRDALLADVRGVIDEAGGTIEVGYQTVLFLARRRG